jgi:hypothetical protein
LSTTTARTPSWKSWVRTTRPPRAVFHGHVVGEVGPAPRRSAPGAALTFSDCRRLGLQRRQLGQRPVGAVGFEGGEDLLDRVEGEQTVDGVQMGLDRRLARVVLQPVGDIDGIGRVGGQDGAEGLERVGRQIVGVDAQATVSAAFSRAPVRASQTPVWPGSRDRNQPPPTSGNRPIPVSGMA